MKKSPKKTAGKKKKKRAHHLNELRLYGIASFQHTTATVHRTFSSSYVTKEKYLVVKTTAESTHYSSLMG